MTTNDTTPAQPAATLSEQGLWERFVSMEITTPTPFGVGFTSYRPEDEIRYSGSYGLAEPTSEAIIEDLAASVTPDDDLENWIEEVEGLLMSLKTIRRDFYFCKQAHLIEPIFPEEPGQDASAEERAAWNAACEHIEANPRYRLPGSADQEAENERRDSLMRRAVAITKAAAAMMKSDRTERVIADDGRGRPGVEPAFISAV